MRGNLKNIDVFILCGGLGKRLKPISGSLPKPMVKINKQPFLDTVINYLADFGFQRFILGIGYRGGLIRDYYRKNYKRGLTILFSQEKVPLDTGGAVKNAKEIIKSNPFLVLNGDTFFKFNPSNFLNFHQQKGSLLTILLRRMPNSKDYGEVITDKSGQILNFSEKSQEKKSCFINAGAYLFDRKIFSLMPSGAKFSLERDLFPVMAGKSIFGYPCGGFFIDIGTPQRYRKARRYFQRINF